MCIQTRKQVLTRYKLCSHLDLMWILGSRILCCGSNRQIHTDYRNPVEKKGLHGRSLSQREGPETPAWTGFYCFLGTLHQGWPSFTMHRFVLGGYLLQKTKERVLLNTSKKKDICKGKGKSSQTGYTPYLGGLAQILGS